MRNGGKTILLQIHGLWTDISSKVQEPYEEVKKNVEESLKQSLKKEIIQHSSSLEALKYEVDVKVQRSIKERKNIMSFMQGSITYLNQRTFEAFIELMDQEKDNPPESTSGPTDI